MSLLLLFGPAGEEPEPSEDVPRRMLMGVGMTLALLIAGGIVG